MISATELTLDVTVGASRQATNWPLSQMTWQQLKDKLQSPATMPVGQDEFFGMTLAEQGELKDCGGYVLGKLDGTRRRRDNVVSRSAIVLDYDSRESLIEPFEFEVFHYALCAHTTAKHTPAKPRQRVIIPLNRNVQPAEYEPICRWVVRELSGFQGIDGTSFEVNRLMFWPAVCEDAPFEFYEQDGPVLDADMVLGTYNDWRDLSELPGIKEAPPSRVGSIKKEKQNPHEAKGIIGVFNRAFGIAQAIDEFLPEVYEASSMRNRYTYCAGSTANGVVVYNNLFLCSHHDTDPVSRYGSVNSWDLVRVHKFGHLDEGLDDFELSVAPPSQQAMKDWVATLPCVQGEEVEKRNSAIKRMREAETEASLRAVCSEIAKEGFKRDSLEMMAQEAKKLLAKHSGTPVTIMLARELLQDFKAYDKSWLSGWVFVHQIDGFFNVDTKQTVTPTGFNAMYDRFMNLDDITASKFATKNLKIRCVDQLMYLPTAGHFFDFEGRSCANTYRDDLLPDTPVKYSAEESRAVGLIEKHLREVICQTEDEYNWLVRWMAHNVQNPGVKIRWSPIIKGVEGDGKTTLAKILGVVMGSTNVTVVGGNTLESKFNDWVGNGCVAMLEELHVGGLNRAQVYDQIKPIITNDVINVNPKGRKTYVMPNIINILAATNREDALPIEMDDRRWFVIFTRFKTKEDLLKLPEGYFKALHNAIHEHPGAIRKWFLDVDLTDFDPSGRAPDSQYKSRMVEFSKTDERIQIEEAIEDGGCGFDNEIVCPKYLREAIARNGTLIKDSTVRKILQKLGYTEAGRIFYNGSSLRFWHKPNAWDGSRERIESLLSSDFLD